MNRHHVLMVVAVAAVAPAIYFAYQLLSPEEFADRRPVIELPAEEGCVGEDCDNGERPDRPSVPGGAPNASAPGGAAGAGGGGGTITNSVMGELLDLGGLNEQCLAWVVDYCDSWQHAGYLNSSLPNGNQTFPQSYPECQQLEFFQKLGQPVQQDCINLYQNISGS